MAPDKIGPSTVELDLDNCLATRTRPRINKPEYYKRVTRATAKAAGKPEAKVVKPVEEDPDWLSTRLEFLTGSWEVQLKNAKLWGMECWGDRLMDLADECR
jgi:hypothetical protein